MVSGRAARNGGWIGLGALVAIFLLGLGLRVGEAWDGRPPVYDAQAYAAIARNLDQGHGFTVGAGATQPSSNYSPGLPLSVAGVYEATGGVHERLARLLLAAIGSLSVLFAYAIGRRLARPPHRPGSSEVGGPAGSERLAKKGGYRRPNSPIVWPALVGALAVAVYPALLEYQGMLMSEPLAAALLSGGVLAVLWAWEGDWLRWLLPGALFGALPMVRPEYLGVTVLVALVVAIRPSAAPLSISPPDRAAGEGRRRGLLRSHGRSLAAAGAMLLAAAVVIAPWTIRNAVALDRFVPVSTGGGQVLYAGTYLPSAGDPERVGAEVVAENPGLFGPGAARHLRLEQILARLAHARYPGMESDQALTKLGKERLWDDVSDHPGEYAGFLAAKVGRIWFHPARDVMRGLPWALLQWALAILGIAGLALLAWRRRWEALLLATILLAITLIGALLVASPRRTLVLVPLLAALAATALSYLAASLGSSSAARLTKPGRAADGLPGSGSGDSLSTP